MPVKAEKPIVSIVTPCYNGEAYLETYFQSLLSQTYDHFELIFVDDGSIDKTAQVIEKYKKDLEKKCLRFEYVYQENAGQAAAMNNGLSRAKGKYLIWPDADDWLDATSIEKRVAFLEAHPEYRFVRSNAEFFDYNTKEAIRRASNEDSRFDSDIFLNLILEKTFCFCGCYMIHLEDLREFYPDLKIQESAAGQNWQILIPIASKHLCGFIDEELYHIAVRSDSHSRQERTFEQSIQRYFELKNVLENAVRLTNRNDRDYQKIIDEKYDRMLMHAYIQQDMPREAARYYRKLRRTGMATPDDKEWYLLKVHPLCFQGYRVKKWIEKRLNR